MPSWRQISQPYKRSVSIIVSTALLSLRSITRSTFGFIVGITFQETYRINIVNNVQDLSSLRNALEGQYISQISYRIQESTLLFLQLIFPRRPQAKTPSIVRFRRLDQLMPVNSRYQALSNRAIATKLRQYYSIRRFVTATNTLSSRRARVISTTYRRPSSSYSTPSASSTNTRSGREVGPSAQNNPQPKYLGIGAYVKTTIYIRISTRLKGIVRTLQHNNNSSAIKRICRKVTIQVVIVRVLQFFFVARDFNTRIEYRKKIRVRVGHIQIR